MCCDGFVFFSSKFIKHFQILTPFNIFVINSIFHRIASFLSSDLKLNYTVKFWILFKVFIWDRNSYGMSETYGKCSKTYHEIKAFAQSTRNKALHFMEIQKLHFVKLLIFNCRAFESVSFHSLYSSVCELFETQNPMLWQCNFFLPSSTLNDTSISWWWQIIKYQA